MYRSVPLNSSGVLVTVVVGCQVTDAVTFLVTVMVSCLVSDDSCRDMMPGDHFDRNWQGKGQ